MNTFTSVDDAQHITQIEPGDVVIRGSSHRQFEREVRRSRERAAIGRQQLHPPGRFAAETTPDSSALAPRASAPGHIGANKPMYQSHVVVEGQPRHHGGVRRWDFSVVLEVVGRIICSKLAITLRCETTTPAGWRVDPDVYCRYAVVRMRHRCSRRASAAKRDPAHRSRSPRGAASAGLPHRHTASPRRPQQTLSISRPVSSHAAPPTPARRACRTAAPTAAQR